MDIPRHRIIGLRSSFWYMEQWSESSALTQDIRF